MSSIIRFGDTFHGISVFGRGVFTNDERGGRLTYAGQIREGYACGLAVLTLSSGTKVYAEHGPDGQFDGRCLDRFANGNTDYYLFERGKAKESTYVYANGRCMYNYEPCAPDDPRVLALIALVAPVEVRPAARAPAPPVAAHSPQSNRPMDRPACFALCRRWRPPWPPRWTPILHAVAGGRATQPNSSRTAKHVHTGFSAVLVTRVARTLLHPLTTAAWGTPRARPGSFAAMP